MAENCGNCVRINPVDGYCRRSGKYVNALSERPCFLARDNEEPVIREEYKSRYKKLVEERKVQLKTKMFYINRTEKVCSRCKRLLPMSEFGIVKKRLDGHNCYCKECNYQRTKEQRERRKLKTLNQKQN